MTPADKSVEQFNQFAFRFARKYWEGAQENAPLWPPHEPFEGTVDEALDEIKITTSCERIAGQFGKAYVLRMTATSGSIWRFIFKRRSRRWNLLAAFANDEIDEYRCDMLGEDYGKYFRSMLEQATKSAQSATFS